MTHLAWAGDAWTADPTLQGLNKMLGHINRDAEGTTYLEGKWEKRKLVAQGSFSSATLEVGRLLWQGALETRMCRMANA